MSNNPQDDLIQGAITAALAGITGFVGMMIGVKVQGTEISNIKERLDRMEAKIDRLIERGHNN